MEIIEIIYLLSFVLVTAIRKYFTARFKPANEQFKKSTGSDKILLALLGIAMLLPLVKIFYDILPFANYQSLEIVQWIGLAFFFVGIIWLYRSHSDLGTNWNPEAAINSEQELVQIGLYKKVRHPMYTAHLLWAIGNMLIFPNWIVGPAMLVVAMIFLPQRIKNEEQLLIREFGDKYREYMTKTNALLPKI